MCHHQTLQYRHPQNWGCRTNANGPEYWRGGKPEVPRKSGVRIPMADENPQVRILFAGQLRSTGDRVTGGDPSGKHSWVDWQSGSRPDLVARWRAPACGPAIGTEPSC